MIDHISLQVANVQASASFYETLLAPLGARRLLEFGDFVGFGTTRPTFWLGPVTNEGVPRETHVAFAADDRAAVTAFHDAAVELGTEILHAPREWPQYHPDYFGAFVRDPDGNNVEAVCHAPA
ncbi:VOC family protein [Nocardiopsis gilva YIM 90087]|uniref:VOC family protein n=1 Tax=Nocardiopsis gilva YIM 90087 TaxID=1235441 RepID=A0A223SC95_9ACTN|nr:VOC family protein [Nocardiopsis gilva]ASU85706.1 VOC family protein [Nocardiopsis gilva YIM 90087]